MRLFLFLLLFVLFQVKSISQNIIEYIGIDSTGNTYKEYYFKQSILSTDSTLISFAYDTAFYNQLKKDLKGLDVSRWQNYIDWKKISELEYKFVFIKASQGLRTDPCFNYNWNNCTLTKGAYHFFDPYINGITQAKHFLNVVNFKKGDLLPVIDVEYTYRWRRVNKTIASKNLKLMLDYIENEIGMKPIIYTNILFWNKYVYPYFKGTPSEYPLWVAHYYVEKPRLPKGWDNWDIWQWTHKGILKGFNGYWDQNYLNGGDLNKITIK